MCIASGMLIASGDTVLNIDDGGGGANTLINIFGFAFVSFTAMRTWNLFFPEKIFETPRKFSGPGHLPDLPLLNVG